MRLMLSLILSGLLVSAVAGCGQSTSVTKPPATTSVSVSVVENSKLLLTEAPKEAQGVIALRKEAKDGDEVVIEGRIGGAVDPWVEGRAAFQIVDNSLVPCNERKGDDCPTPWDYCCDSDVLPKSKATVKFVDAQGKTLSTDARQLLGIKELQTVIVKGQAKRDEAGNLTVLASSMFVKPASTKPLASEKSK
jgi:hypothetical protein